MILCGHKIERGEKKYIKIHVNEEYALDVILYCGAFPGKTLVVAAGVHGCEYVGIEAIKRLIKEYIIKNKENKKYERKNERIR